VPWRYGAGDAGTVLYSPYSLYSLYSPYAECVQTTNTIVGGLSSFFWILFNVCRYYEVQQLMSAIKSISYRHWDDGILKRSPCKKIMKAGTTYLHTAYSTGVVFMIMYL
jgi:hypothetical protein